MPYYKAIVHIPGGKELKLEKNSVPEELYHALRAVNDPEIIEIFENKLELTDELHNKLQRNKAYSTYIIYGVTFFEGQFDKDKFKEAIIYGLQIGNVITPVESVYGYQILKLEYMYPDDNIPYENRAEPGEGRISAENTEN